MKPKGGGEGECAGAAAKGRSSRVPGCRGDERHARAPREAYGKRTWEASGSLGPSGA